MIQGWEWWDHSGFILLGSWWQLHGWPVRRTLAVWAAVGEITGSDAPRRAPTVWWTSCSQLIIAAGPAAIVHRPNKILLFGLRIENDCKKSHSGFTAGKYVTRKEKEGNHLFSQLTHSHLCFQPGEILPLGLKFLQWYLTLDWSRELASLAVWTVELVDLLAERASDVFQVNPRDRPSISSVLQRPFLQKHISKHHQVLTLQAALWAQLDKGNCTRLWLEMWILGVKY